MCFFKKRSHCFFPPSSSVYQIGLSGYHTSFFLTQSPLSPNQGQIGEVVGQSYDASKGQCPPTAVDSRKTPLPKKEQLFTHSNSPFAKILVSVLLHTYPQS